MLCLVFPPDCLWHCYYCDSLPPRCRCVDEWLLAHSTHIHGESFSLFYHHISECSDIVIVIQTTEGHVFGVFVPIPIHPSGPRCGKVVQYV